MNTIKDVYVIGIGMKLLHGFAERKPPQHYAEGFHNEVQRGSNMSEPYLETKPYV